MKATKNKIQRITSNKSKRHFTIIKEDGTKYRTYPMSKIEFQDALHNTLNDWEHFLRIPADIYYKI